MGLDDSLRHYSCRRFVLGLILILAGIMACMASLFVMTDSACHQAAQHWLPHYPGAMMVEETYSFLRAYGIGTTRQVLETQNDRETVYDWYRAADKANGEAGHTQADAKMNWHITEAETGGSIVVLTSECAKDADLSSMGIGS